MQFTCVLAAHAASIRTLLSCCLALWLAGSSSIMHDILLIIVAICMDGLLRMPALVRSSLVAANMPLCAFGVAVPDIVHMSYHQTCLAVLQAYTAGAPTCGYTVTVAGSVSTAYPVGSWFTPCVCWDTECTR